MGLPAVLAQNADSAHRWQTGSSETSAAQTAARQMPAPALGRWPAGEISPAELTERFKKLFGNG